MAARAWADAVRHYEAVLAEQPANAAIWVQHGHALKEMGELAQAANSYMQAIAAAPVEIDGRVHLGYLRREQGLFAEANDTFLEILEIDPGHHEAYTMLVEGGARHRLPLDVQRSAGAIDLSILQKQLVELGRRVDKWIDLSIYPLNNYHGFRRDFTIKPPPRERHSAPSIRVEVDARYAAPYLLRSTLLSLIEQVDADWTAIVRARDMTAAHPVASLAADARISFDAEPPPADYVLHISAGTVLDAHALAWFKFTLGRTGAVAAYCDFDHATDHWRHRRSYADPILWGVFDLDMIAQSTSPPAAIVVRASVRSSNDLPGPDNRRAMLIAASGQGAVAHIPRLLATVLRAPDQALGAPGKNDLEPSPARGPSPGLVSGTAIELVVRKELPLVSVGPKALRDSRIQIVIPTRDAATMLEKACSTLLSLASAPDLIDLTIVDNRSCEDETATLLAEFAARPNVTVVPLDEPFNWSRANNIGMKASAADIVLFANNDVEMLTQGWDDLLRGYLARDEIGAVGCRLLYPDDSLQHGGILFGLGEGPPIHDGAAVPKGTTGPQDRFILTHLAAAVTGAFLAARREVIDQIGGFDEVGLAIAYNDVDFCLNVRAAGLKILYAPAIELIHYESKTRGLADAAVKIAWDLGELGTLHARWGDALLTDPGYNPHWSSGHQYDGFQNPSLERILEHIDLSVQSDPWLVTRDAPSMDA